MVAANHGLSSPLLVHLAAMRISLEGVDTARCSDCFRGDFEPSFAGLRLRGGAKKGRSALL